MEVTGKIHVLGQKQQITSEFVKQELVVKTDEQYPQFISINFIKEKCDLLNNFNVGQSVKVNINIRGREWTNPVGEVKYFNDIQGWKIELLADANNIEVNQPVFAGNENLNVEDDNLPF